MIGYCVVLLETQIYNMYLSIGCMWTLFSRTRQSDVVPVNDENTAADCGTGSTLACAHLARESGGTLAQEAAADDGDTGASVLTRVNSACRSV